MTSFSSASALMPLDEYYDQCVFPKPNIPKPYPGFSGYKKKKREAAHLQSYKDNDETDEDDDDDDGDIGGDEVEQQHVDEFVSSIQDSNMNQIDFETNEFNVLYDEANEVTDMSEQTSTRAVPETPARSAQWRIKANNINRPPGAAPLVPIKAPRGRFQAGAARASRGIQRRRYNNNNNNYNRNNPQYSIKDRIGYKQARNSQCGQFPMRAAGNPFNNNNTTNNNNNNNHNNGNMQQQVFMNMNHQFQSSQAQINLSTQLIPMQQLNPSLSGQNNMFGNLFNNSINLNDSVSNNFVSSNSISSLINAANQIGSINNNYNAFTRLGPPPPRTNLNQLQYGNSQLQCVSNNNGIVCSDSLRLADLMNIDRSSCKNLNVAEVAKNAMLLLSSVYHKPILDDNVQQELSQLQQNNGLPEEPTGVDVQINPEATDLRLYHRFK